MNNENGRNSGHYYWSETPKNGVPMLGHGIKTDMSAMEEKALLWDVPQESQETGLPRLDEVIELQADPSKSLELVSGKDNDSCSADVNLASIAKSTESTEDAKGTKVTKSTSKPAMSFAEMMKRINETTSVLRSATYRKGKALLALKNDEVWKAEGSEVTSWKGLCDKYLILDVTYTTAQGYIRSLTSFEILLPWLKRKAGRDYTEVDIPLDTIRNLNPLISCRKKLYRVWDVAIELAKESGREFPTEKQVRKARNIVSDMYAKWNPNPKKKNSRKNLKVDVSTDGKQTVSSIPTVAMAVTVESDTLKCERLGDHAQETNLPSDDFQPLLPSQDDPAEPCSSMDSCGQESASGGSSESDESIEDIIAIKGCDSIDELAAKLEPYVRSMIRGNKEILLALTRQLGIHVTLADKGLFIGNILEMYNRFRDASDVWNEAHPEYAGDSLTELLRALYNNVLSDMESELKGK